MPEVAAQNAANNRLNSSSLTDEHDAQTKEKKKIDGVIKRKI
jgi:hypothetical protein